jgi:hypothetical protein
MRKGVGPGLSPGPRSFEPFVCDHNPFKTKYCNVARGVYTYITYMCCKTMFYTMLNARGFWAKVYTIYIWQRLCQCTMHARLCISADFETYPVVILHGPCDHVLHGVFARDFILGFKR